MKRFLAVLKSAAGYLAMAALIIGLGYFMLQLSRQKEVLHEITPDIGMTKSCTQTSDQVLTCSQVPTPREAAPSTPDPNAPLYVTVAPAE